MGFGLVNDMTIPKRDKFVQELWGSLSISYGDQWETKADYEDGQMIIEITIPYDARNKIR